MWGKGMARGLAVTLKHLFRPAVTIQYPNQLPPQPERTRSKHVFVAERCTSCLMCAKVCPVACIDIQASRGEDKKMQLHSYEIDFAKCLFCGLCSEACPTECLTMGPDFEMSASSRDDLVYAAEDLAEGKVARDRRVAS